MTTKKQTSLLKSIKRFFAILFLGQEHARPINHLRPAIKNQWLNVLRIWRNKHYKDFGLERIIRLTLAFSQFIFPVLYVRHFFSSGGLLGRKIGVEVYVILKLFLPLIFFKLDLTSNFWVALFTAYMTLDTIFYLACLIFLSNEFASPISFRRSLTAIFINYIELGLDYAVIYSYCNFNIPGFFKEKLTTDMQAIYFSFVTSATVGYGDIVTTKPFGQFFLTRMYRF